MRDKESPECRWVTVVDADGRSRLEMRWRPPVAAQERVVADLVVAQAQVVARAA